MVLHVQPAGHVVVTDDFVDALAELRVRIRLEAGADTCVRGRERLPAILAQVMAAGGDPEMDAIAVADDRVHAQPAGARVPLARVLVVADARHHLP